MKQHITPTQALEIFEDQFYSFFDSEGMVKRDDWFSYHHKKVTIGKMIELLSDKYSMPHMVKHCTEGKVYHIVNGRGYHIEYENNCTELCDALWEAVKVIKGYNSLELRKE